MTPHTNTMTLSYKEAGVDVPGIERSLSGIAKLVSSTHGLQRKAGVARGFGHYAGIVEIPGGDLIATHTDGVGTKTMIASQMKRYDTVGIDCMAMNVNDIVCVGATPISFVDYIAANTNNAEILQDIVRGLVVGAKMAHVPIVGGETAIMPDLFAGEEFIFDLAGAVVGLIPGGRMMLGDAIEPGDVIIGAESTGIHSNGYTLARKALAGYSLTESIEGVGILGNALLEPTAIYSGPVLEAVEGCEVHGLAHITGGSFTKLLRLKDAGYQIDSLPETPPIMRLIQDQGISRTEMYKTFNMGVGFCIIAPEDQASSIAGIFGRHEIRTHEIGRIVHGNGVFVNAERVA